MALRVLFAASAVAVLLSCTHAEPMPPRADPSAAVPERVRDDPNFDASRAEGIDPTKLGKPPEDRRTLCERRCPQGQHCVLEHGLERCVADEPKEAP